jgi:O-antigen/teichoic acid export membrane protein
MASGKASPFRRLLQGTLVFGSRNVLLIVMDFSSALLLIRLLSTENYARLTLALSARSLAAIFLNMGLGSFIATEVARSHGQGRLDRVKRYLLRYSQMNLLTGLGLFLLTLVAQWPLRHFVSPLIAWLAFIVGFELLVTAWRHIFQTTFYGYARFKSMGSVDVLESVFRLGLIGVLVILLQMGLRGAILIYPLSTALALFVVMPQWFQIVWSLRQVSASRDPVFREGLKGPGKWVVLQRPLKQVRSELPIWLIQTLVGKSGVALFAVAQRGYRYTALLLRALEEVLLPLVSENVDTDHKTTRQLVSVVDKYAFVGAVGLVIVGSLLSPVVYDLVFEYPTAAATYRLLLIALLPRALSLHQRPLLYALRGQKFLTMVMAFSLFWLTLGVALGVFWLGVIGAALGMLVNVCLTAILQQWAIRRLSAEFYIEWRSFFRIDELDRRLFMKLRNRLSSRLS